MQYLEKEFDELAKNMMWYASDHGKKPDYETFKRPLYNFIKDKIKEVVESCPIDKNQKSLRYFDTKGASHLVSFGKWRDNILDQLK